jgi:hypothetical protein
MLQIMKSSGAGIGGPQGTSLGGLGAQKPSNKGYVFTKA